MEFEILYAINELHNPILDKIMVAITSLGNAGLIWIGIAVFLIFIKKFLSPAERYIKRLTI